VVGLEISDIGIEPILVAQVDRRNLAAMLCGQVADLNPFSGRKLGVERFNGPNDRIHEGKCSPRAIPFPENFNVRRTLERQ
jgi:hypothetical protein